MLLVILQSAAINLFNFSNVHQEMPPPRDAEDADENPTPQEIQEEGKSAEAAEGGFGMDPEDRQWLDDLMAKEGIKPNFQNFANFELLDFEISHLESLSRKKSLKRSGVEC